MEVKPVKQVFSEDMKNSDYSIIVYPYAFGQFRIQLTNTTKDFLGMAPEGHGDIIREMCTYDQQKALRVVGKIAEAEDPEAYCETLARPFNCEYPGGRIRLDNSPEDRIENRKEWKH